MSDVVPCGNSSYGRPIERRLTGPPGPPGPLLRATCRRAHRKRARTEAAAQVRGAAAGPQAVAKPRGPPALDSVRDTNVIPLDRQVAMRRATAGLLRTLDRPRDRDEPETSKTLRDVSAAVDLRRGEWPD